MFENIKKFIKNLGKKEEKKQSQENSRDAAKERLHLVLMQDRANVSADFLELMKQEIIEVIKKYIEVDEKEIDVRLTNKENEDGTNGAPALYANIPILNIKNDARKINKTEVENKKQEEINNKNIAENENTKQKEIKQEDTEKEFKNEETLKKIENKKGKDELENKEQKETNPITIQEEKVNKIKKEKQKEKVKSENR